MSPFFQAQRLENVLLSMRIGKMESSAQQQSFKWFASYRVST